MKVPFWFAWTWLAALAFVAAVSLSGCRTGSPWRAERPKSDPPRLGKGEGSGAFAPSGGVRPCRFG